MQSRGQTHPPAPPQLPPAPPHSADQSPPSRRPPHPSQAAAEPGQSRATRGAAWSSKRSCSGPSGSLQAAHGASQRCRLLCAAGASAQPSCVHAAESSGVLAVQVWQSRQEKRRKNVSQAETVLTCLASCTFFFCTFGSWGSSCRLLSPCAATSKARANAISRTSAVDRAWMSPVARANFTTAGGGRRGRREGLRESPLPVHAVRGSRCLPCSIP